MCLGGAEREVAACCVAGTVAAMLVLVLPPLALARALAPSRRSKRGGRGVDFAFEPAVGTGSLHADLNACRCQSCVKYSSCEYLPAEAWTAYSYCKLLSGSGQRLRAMGSNIDGHTFGVNVVLWKFRALRARATLIRLQDCRNLLTASEACCRRSSSASSAIELG